MEKQLKSYGYYYVSLSLPDGHRLLRSNSERAFVVSQLQDLLTPRLLMDSTPDYKQLASYVDLLAFSIRAESIELILFAIDASLPTHLINHIAARLVQYQDECQPYRYKQSQASFISVKKLRGPHQALEKTVALHLMHSDWEYDRYSSIGFYLHDRRGEWMRTWRLTSLYDNESAHYQQLVEGCLATNLSAHSPKLQLSAS